MEKEIVSWLPLTEAVQSLDTAEDARNQIEFDDESDGGARNQIEFDDESDGASGV